MSFSDDHSALAAEYVLGSLDSEERAQVETMMAVDANFAALIRAWELRLGELHAMVDPVEPRGQVWENIRAAISGVAQQPELPLPAVPQPTAPTAEMAPLSSPRREAEIVVLSQQVRRWRGASIMTGAIAAALALFLVIGAWRPDLLPSGIRPGGTQMVQVQPSGQFVAVLQRDAAAPAFIMTVDLAAKSYTVRRVSAAPEPGKSYELWLVSDRFPAPRSLGVIGTDDFTKRPALASYDQDTINAATYAVSVEPEGGSPTGAVTGPVVFSGKLVEAVPPDAPPAPTRK